MRRVYLALILVTATLIILGLVFVAVALVMGLAASLHLDSAVLKYSADLHARANRFRPHSSTDKAGSVTAHADTAERLRLP